MNINVTKTTGVICKTKGKYCAEDITVVPVLEEKSATPTQSAQEIVPSAGNCGISKVNIGAVQAYQGTATPAQGEQTINPTNGKFFSSFKVGAIPSDYVIPTGTLQITENGTYDVTEKASVNVNVPSGVEEVATAAAMDALLVESNVGKYYKFTGTTDSNYTNGDIYLVEGEQGAYKFKHYAQEIIPQGYNDCLTFVGKESEFTLKATNKAWDGTLEYSTDHNTWTTLAGTEAMQSANKVLYLRGKNSTFYSNYKGVKWVLSDKADCSGNIQTLLNWENPPTSISTSSCYSFMFEGCINLTTAPELPATTLAELCYYYMFSGCTSLTTAPALPATILAKKCYSHMFYLCANLTKAPALPATTLEGSCYSNMLRGCTNLIKAPALPATNLANDCYNSMFSGCTNLTAAPELPATTLVDSCYYLMFSGCSKLKVNTTSGNKIFTCPSTIPSYAVTDMFKNTGGSFTGNPTAGTTYYYTV